MAIDCSRCFRNFSTLPTGGLYILQTTMFLHRGFFIVIHWVSMLVLEVESCFSSVVSPVYFILTCVLSFSLFYGDLDHFCSIHSHLYVYIMALGCYH